MRGLLKIFEIRKTAYLMWIFIQRLLPQAKLLAFSTTILLFGTKTHTENLCYWDIHQRSMLTRIIHTSLL